MSRGKKLYHHGNLKLAAIDLATNQIAKSGPQSVKLRELANILGVSHSAFFKHFASRNDLIFTIATEGYRLLGEKLRSIKHEELSFSEVLREWAQMYLQFATEYPGYFSVMFTVKEADKLQAKQLRKLSKDSYHFLVTSFEKYLGKKTNLEAIVVTAWSFIHGLATLEQNGQLDLPNEETKAEHKQFLNEVLQTFIKNFASSF